MPQISPTILFIRSAETKERARSRSAFTIIEVCIALAIAVLMLSVAIPSLTGVMKQNKAQDSFTAFDHLVQEAHDRSVSEQRAYVLVWTPKFILLRPDAPSGKSESDGMQKWPISKDDSVKLFLPAALVSKPDAIWTFWPSGACEPAIVDYKGSEGAWSADYNAFTVDAKVHYL